VSILVVGAGGVGGYFGGLLARAGEPVAFMARGPHLEALQAQGGVRLHTVHGELFAPARALGAPDEPAELVLFTVKAYDTETAAARIVPAVGPQTVILSLQNGVDNEEVLAARFGPERVWGGTAYIFAAIEAPGVVRQTGGPRAIRFGAWAGRGLTDRLRAWEARFRAAGFEAEALADILPEKWSKFIFICALAGVSALTRLPLGEVRASPPTWALFRGLLEEGVAVARARGVPLPPDLVDRHAALAEAQPPDSRASLATDLLAGRRLEVEALHGTLVRYGREAGVPTPLAFAAYAALLPHHQRAVGTGAGGG
jgi:2-dehydropantoate 2-reductase